MLLKILMDTSYVVLAIVSFVAILIWAYIVVTSKDFPRMTDEEIAAGDQEFQDSLVDDDDDVELVSETVVKEVKKKSPGKLTVAIEKLKTNAKPIKTKKKPVQKATGKPRSRKKKGS